MTARPEPALSAVVTTKNNARSLARCLASLRFCDEILVLDSFSSDATFDIAQAHGARWHQQPFAGYGAQKQAAIDLAVHDWVLLLDADEFLDEAAATVIRRAIGDERAVAFRLPRREWLFWRWPNRATRANDQLRLFRRSMVRMSGHAVHAAPSYQGDAPQLALGFYHQGEPDLATRVRKVNDYSSGLLQDYRAKRPRLLGLRVVLYPSWVFFKTWLLKGYVLNGWAGFLAARTASFYAFLKYAKVLEARERAANASRPQSPAACDGVTTDEVPR